MAVFDKKDEKKCLAPNIPKLRQASWLLNDWGVSPGGSVDIYIYI